MGITYTGGSDNAAPTTANTTQYTVFSGSIGQGFTTTEANAQVLLRDTGTFNNFGVYVNGNSVNQSTTIRTRKNGANGNLNVTVGAAATGHFSDIVDSDTIAAGDKYNLQTVPGSGSTGTMNINASLIGFTATTSTDAVTKLIAAGPQSYTTASSTRYSPLNGRIGTNTQTTESFAQTEERETATLKNLTCHISANARTTTSTFKSRKNTADGGMTMSIGSTATGWFEDTSNTTSVAAGDDVCYGFVTGTGTQSLTVDSMAVTYLTASSANIGHFICADPAGRTTNAATTVYLGVSGTLVAGSSSAENTLAREIFSDYTFGDLTINVTANSVSATSTARLRINNANGTLVASITSNTTGMFTDSTHTDAVVANDKLAIQYASGATGTSVSYRSISCHPVLAAPAGTQYNRSPSTENISISDASLDRIKSAARVPSTDSTTVTDSSLTRMTQAFRTPSADTITISDASLTVSKAKSGVPSADTTTVTDSSLTRLLSAVRVPSADTTTVTAGTSTRATQAFRLPSTDSTTVTDSSLTKSETRIRVPGADTTTVTDSSLTRLLSAIRVPSADTTTVVDSSLTRSRGLSRVPSADTIAISDASLVRLLSLVRVPSADSTTVTAGTSTRLLSLVRSPSDTTVITDSALTRMLSLIRLPSQDTIAAPGESVTGLKTVAGINYTRSPTADTTTVSDGALTRLCSLLRVPSAEIVSIIDSSLTRMTQAFRVPGAETVTLSENVTGLLIVPGQFNRSPVAETITVTEQSLVRRLSLVRIPTTDTSAVTENLSGGRLFAKAPSADTVTVGPGTVTRVRSLSRSPTESPTSIIESALIRLFTAIRAPPLDIVTVAEINSVVQHSKTIQEAIAVTEPIINRIVTNIRSLSDSIDIDESVFFQTWHRYVYDYVEVGDQLFIVRSALSGPVTYAIPDEVRPLLGNLGSQRTDPQIELAIDAAYDEINTKTNRIPPNDWKDTDHNFGIVKKLTRFIAAREMAIGIKDYDTKPLDMEIEHLFNDLLQYDTTSDATQDIVVSSSSETYAASSSGLIWSTRYANLRKNISGGEGDTHLM